MKRGKKALLCRAKSFRIGAALLLTTVALFAAVTAAHAQTFNVLYNFGANPGDPENPWQGLLAQGRDGNFYSTTFAGGTFGQGTVFKITPTGSLTVLYNFDGILAAYPIGGLALGTDGNFYGTTFFGGTGQCNGIAAGTVFKITPEGGLTVLHNFGDDGCLPTIAPIEAPDGNFYGTTSHDSYGNAGMVYKMTPSGKIKVLHQFGSYEQGTFLLQATDGNLYGTSPGGPYPDLNGLVYKLTPSGEFTYLHYFDGVHGAGGTSLVQRRDGVLFGTTGGGGSAGAGVVFRLATTGSYKPLYQFNGNNGSRPTAALLEATDDNFYGTAENGGPVNAGTIYRIGPNASLSVLYNFDGTTGSVPDAPLFQHTNGIFYGDTSEGGPYGGCAFGGCGTLFSLDVGLVPFVRLVSTSGQIGKNIGILGQGFTGTTSVSFNGIAATFNAVSDTYLEAYVPDGAITGSVTVTTPTGALISNKIFRVTPKILSFSPTSGAVGTPVVITGTGLTQTLRVGFGSVAASSFTIDSDTQVTAIVPDGAVTGKIAIATQGGHDTGTRVFTVTP